MTMPSRIRESIDGHLDSLAHLRESAEGIADIAEAMRGSLDAGGKILTCGNGGSAAEALHLAEEMMGRFERKRSPLAAVCLSSDPTALTCISNDYGYEEVFARQVAGLGRRGDVLVALSTSGRSPNVVNALQRAKDLGLVTVGLLGQPGSPAQPLCDLAFTTPASRSAHIQELHLMVIHLILEQLDGVE